MKIIKIFFKIKKVIYCKLNPIKYARSIGVELGNNVKFYGAKSKMFSTEPWLISIGNNSHITSEVQFLTHDGGTLITKESTGDFILCGNINIGNNVYIGTRTTILPGVTIGDNSIIGCCSVVTKDIPSNTVAVGNPCKPINTVNSYIDKIENIKKGNDSRYISNLDELRKNKPSNFRY